MRKIIIATAATLGVFAAVGLPTATAAGKTRHFTLTGIGHSVGAYGGVAVFHGPGGYRAVQLGHFTSNNYQAAVGGSSTERDTLFDARGTILFAGQATAGPLQANGTIAIKGTERSISGTGIYRHVKETLKITASLDVRTGLDTSTSRVTQTL
jgi:hypothetical protein